MALRSSVATIQLKRYAWGSFGSRMQRLSSTEEEGLGEQRFKFINKTKQLTAAKEVAFNGGPATFREASTAVLVTHSIGSETTRLASAFVERIYPLVDIRVQLQWNFGDFLKDIPCRLGTNTALDAASDALVAAHRRFCAGFLEPDSKLLAKHSRALNVLRHDLDDTVKAHASETLCAIMLLMITEALINPARGMMASHPEGAALILKSRGLSGPRDEFERKLLLTLRGPVVFEALVNERIQFTRHEWENLVLKGLDGTNVYGRWMRCMACVPDLMRRCRVALTSCYFSEVIILDLKLETDSLREECKSIITVLRDCLASFDETSAPAELAGHIHAHHLRSLALALTTGVLLHCIDRALECESRRNCEESSQWSKEILQLAKVAIKYLPLGSLSMALCLMIVWISTSDEDTKDKTRVLLSDYERAYPGKGAADWTARLEETRERFILGRP